MCGNVGIIRDKGCLIPREVVAVSDGRAFRGMCSLGLYEYHTEGGPCSVDGCRGSILEHRHAFDILRVKERDVVHGHAVYHDQWIAFGIVTQCSHTTYAQGGLAIDVAIVADDRQPWNGTLQGLGHILLWTSGHGL